MHAQMMKSTIVALLLATASFSSASPAQVDAARGVLQRLLGERAEDFSLSIIPKEGNVDVFEISAKDGTVDVKGSSGMALCRGSYEYLKETCHVLYSWDARNINVPAVFPDYAQKRVVCPHQYVHYFNVCTFGYTMPWWDWERWEREIDWMALHGINMPLALTGQEAVWQKVWNEYGLSDDEIRSFFSGPAFLPWHRMGNLNSHDGPLPQQWIDVQRELQHKILERERSLGMTPVIQAFAGFLPPAFAEAHSDLKIQKSSGWCDFEPTYLLNPAEPMFVEIGKRFTKAMIDEYGTDHYYLSDTFIEMKPTFEKETFKEDFANIGESVYRGIAEADPDGVWVLMGWPFLVDKEIWGEEEIAAMFSRVPLDKCILLDLAIEACPIWEMRKAFHDQQWISSIIHNYGQHTISYGILPFIASAHQDVQASPECGNHVGAGITPEGIEQNSIVYELQTDAIWSKEPVDLKHWLPAYQRQRYGASVAAMEKAWTILANSIYGVNMRDDSEVNLVAALPCTTTGPNLAYTFSETFPCAQLHEAIELFLECEPQLRGSDAYRRDLVDLVKFYILLGDRLNIEQLNAAHEAGDYAKRDALIEKFMQRIDDLDRLVATRPEYRLSKWIHAARAKANGGSEADLYEQNARRIITRWGDHGNLSDYARREWTGLLNGYYGKRWRMFFDRLQSAGNEPFDWESFTKDRMDWSEAWVRSTAPVAEHAEDDEIVIVRELLNRYGGWHLQLEQKSPAESEARDNAPGRSL